MCSSHLPTTRSPAGCCLGTSTPKELAGILEQPGRTWGERGGRRSRSQTVPVSLRGGWEMGGVPMPGGTLRGRRIREEQA